MFLTVKKYWVPQDKPENLSFQGIHNNGLRVLKKIKLTIFLFSEPGITGPEHFKIDSNMQRQAEKLYLAFLMVNLHFFLMAFGLAMKSEPMEVLV